MKKKTIKAKLAKTEKKLARAKTKLSAAKTALKAAKKEKPVTAKAGSATKTKKQAAKKPVVKKPATKKPAAKKKTRRPVRVTKPVEVSFAEVSPESNGTPAIEVEAIEPAPQPPIESDGTQPSNEDNGEHFAAA